MIEAHCVQLYIFLADRLHLIFPQALSHAYISYSILSVHTYTPSTPKGRLEAYLPENKVFFYERPDNVTWVDRCLPPPRESIRETVFDCADVKDIHQIDKDVEMPTHGGHHYCSTAVEWLKLISAIKMWRKTGVWKPDVSLNDGLRAVDMGMKATASIVNERNASDYYQRALSCPVHE